MKIEYRQVFAFIQRASTLVLTSAITILISASCTLEDKEVAPVIIRDDNALRQALWGDWMLDNASLGKLTTIGCRKYLDAESHMIRLKPDGGCIYRTFSGFPNFHGDIEKETREYENFFMEGARYGVPYESWYVLLRDGTNISSRILGPYEHRPSVTNGFALKNKWPKWNLVDWGEQNKRNQRNMGERYSVQFYAQSSSQPRMGSHWTIRTIDGQIVLVKWAGHSDDTVSFRKVTQGSCNDVTFQQATNGVSR